MRLPYLQVSADLLDHVARDLAVLLNIGEPAAGWMALKLWQYGLSRATGDAPPDGKVEGVSAAVLIEAAVGWPGERGAFVTAALDPSVGLLEDMPTGFRIRGMDRYASTWTKNRKDKERLRRSRDVAATSPLQSSEVAAVSPGKTQTYTQTEKKKEEPPKAPQGAGLASTPLGEQLDAVFLELRGAPYARSFADERALGALLGKPGWSDAEGLRRWRIALQARYPACSTWAELAKHWNAYAKAEAAGKPADVTRGVVRAEAAKHAPAGILEDF